MAEPRRQALLQPFRRVAERVRAAGALRLGLGNERVFWMRLQALDGLPACVSFDPFALPGPWQTALHDAAPVPAVDAPTLRAWSSRLTERARRRQPLALAPAVTTPPAPSPAVPATEPALSAAQPRMAHATRPPNPTGVGPMSTPAVHSTAYPPPQTGRAAGKAGAWTALLEVAALVDTLEARHLGRAPATVGSAVSQPMTGDGPGGAPAPGQAAAPGAVPSGVPPATSNSSPGTATAATPMHTPAPLASLAALVETLWPASLGSPAAGAGRAGSEAHPPLGAPAPRAPSRLLGELRGSTAVAPLAGAPAPATDARTGSSWPEAPAGTADDLAERLNQRLLEQAWLRGVDLT
jgi:hypothetical protein